MNDSEKLLKAKLDRMRYEMVQLAHKMDERAEGARSNKKCVHVYNFLNQALREDIQKAIQTVERMTWVSPE